MQSPAYITRTTPCLQKTVPVLFFSFLNNSVKHWPTSIFMAGNIKMKCDVNGCSFAHLTLILQPHYRVKCRSCT